MLTGPHEGFPLITLALTSGPWVMDSGTFMDRLTQTGAEQLSNWPKAT